MGMLVRRLPMGMDGTHNGDTVGERGLEAKMFIRGLGEATGFHEP
jgi:hypothetical protein